MFPAAPKERTTTIWKAKIAAVSLSSIASAAVNFGSAMPLLIPSFVSLPAPDTMNCSHHLSENPCKFSLWRPLPFKLAAPNQILINFVFHYLVL
jgi:hypothetical protein